MNKAFGILCFGDKSYFKSTITKIDKILNRGFKVYILTDNVEYFDSQYSETFVKVIPYTRTFKSYHDKLILVKHMTKYHDISIIIDADLEISDWSFLDDLKTYNFKYGISYLENLKGHQNGKERVKDLVSDHGEWGSYKMYVNKVYPSYGELETIWEYLLIFNKIGLNSKFFEYYEKLQLCKDFSDLNFNKTVNGAGEGVSISIAAKLSNSDIQKDDELYNLISNKLTPNN
jgi:hypothetical protein